MTKKKTVEKKKYKLVAITSLWINTATKDMPMFLPGPVHEYIIGWYEGKPPGPKEIGEAMEKYLPFIQAQVDENNFELYSGHEIYDANSLTNLENFQMQIGMSVDFPAKDLTSIELPDRVSLALNRD